MNKTTLVVMAAGIGSRYGAGIKQLERVGACGEIIIDFSIFDAIKAGFNKVVFIIRRDIEKEFKEIIGDRISELIEVEYAYQRVDDLPDGFSVPEGRKKPWGTGQAVLCCKDIVKEPFAVINADDYYGREAFVKIHDFLAADDAQDDSSACMAGFVLKNTLSDNGTVTRGVCTRGADDMLESVEETYSIEQKGDRAVGKDRQGIARDISLDAVVSMNMWGLKAGFFKELDRGFCEFLECTFAAGGEGVLKSEYLLPDIIGGMLKENRIGVKILDTSDKWYGITYEQDKDKVSTALRAITDSGVYPKPLFK